MNPDTKSLAYQRMEPEWVLPDTLLAGTRAMRAAANEYLPAHPAEPKKRYDDRLKRTFLRNFYARTLTQLVSKLFDEPMKLQQDVPDLLKQYAEDVDLSGRHLNVFAQAVSKWAIHHGMSFILVDMEDGGEGDAVASRSRRPYMVEYQAKDVLFVSWAIQDGKEVVTKARLKRVSMRESPDGWGDEAVEEILELTPDSWRTFEKSGGGWELAREGDMTLGVVPLVPVYTNRIAPFLAMPTLADLADMNLEHWQIRSDQRVALSVSSFPIPCASGYNPEVDSDVAVGPFNMLSTTEPQGKFYYLESNGQSLAAGEKELTKLEDQMRMYGLQFQIRQQQTATGSALDAQESNSPLQSWATNIADAFEVALGYMARYAELGEDGGSVEMKTAEPLDAASAQEADVLLRACVSGKISREQWAVEMQRRGILGEDYDAEADAARLDSGALSGFGQ